MTNVTITLDDEVLRLARERAAAECRSLSRQVAFWILQDAALKNGADAEEVPA